MLLMALGGWMLLVACNSSGSGSSVDVVMEDGREPAELLPAVEAHWKEQCYDIDRHRLDDPDPDLIGRRKGFALVALAVPGSGRLNIGGDTPCVPNPERDKG